MQCLSVLSGVSVSSQQIISFSETSPAGCGTIYPWTLFLRHLHIPMVVDHGRGQGDKSPPPEFGAGDANANCPPRFCHIGTKMSVLWPSKYVKIRSRPGPRWGSSRRSPRPLSWLERGHPSPYAIPLDTDPPSALAMRPPRSPARSTPMHIPIFYHDLNVKTTLLLITLTIIPNSLFGYFYC